MGVILAVDKRPTHLGVVAMQCGVTSTFSASVDSSMHE